MPSNRTASGKRTAKAKIPERVATVREFAMSTSTMGGAAMIPEDKVLTDMQKLFVKYWVEGDNIPNAMTRAGYNDQPSYGYRMAKMPNILAAKAKYAALYAEASKMTKARVMDMLMESYDMAKLAGEPATMVSAAREVGRLCGFYEPTRVKVDVNVTDGRMARLNSLSDEELLKLIESGDAAPLLSAQEGQESPLDGLDDLLDMQ